MPLVEHDPVIQQVSAATPHPTLGNSVVPRATKSRATGLASPIFQRPAEWEMLATTTGDRPLGLQAAQLLAVANWLRTNVGPSVSVVTKGIRNQVIAVTSAALEPTAFTRVESRQWMGSLDYLLTNSIPFRSSPELFCLDLFKDFDLDRLSLMAVPTEVKRIGGESLRGKKDSKKYQ